MGRVYTVTFANLSLTGDGDDLLEVIAASGKPLQVLAALFSLYESETNEQLTGEIRLATGSYTSGSGGSAVTPTKASSTLPAASFSAEKGNSTSASAGTGALTAMHTEGFPSQGGWAWLPTPEQRPVLQGGEAIVFHLVKGTASASGWNGTVYVEEL